MIYYQEIFNGKDIYSYPFTEKIEYFFILGYTNIYTLSEIDFNALKKYLEYKNIDKIFITNGNFTEEYNINKLSYKDYYQKYFKMSVDYNIFWNQCSGISMSIESFGLVGGDLEFIKFMIKEIGQEELIERFKEFIVEWKGWGRDTWASKLVNKKNCIDLFKIDFN